MFDNEDGQLDFPSGEILGAGLVLFCLLGVGVDLYRWVAHGRTPSLAVLYIPTFAIMMVRRILVAESDRRVIPIAWSGPLCAYYAAIVAFAAGRGIRTRSDELLAGFAVFNLAAILLRAYLDRRKLAAGGDGAHEAHG